MIGLFVGSFFIIWTLIQMHKQVKICMQRSHGRLMNLVVRIFFITSAVYTILYNFLKRIMMETFFLFTIPLLRIGKIFLMMIRIPKAVLTNPLSRRNDFKLTLVAIPWIPLALCSFKMCPFVIFAKKYLESWSRTLAFTDPK